MQVTFGASQSEPFNGNGKQQKATPLGTRALDSGRVSSDSFSRQNDEAFSEMNATFDALEAKPGDQKTLMRHARAARMHSVLEDPRLTPEEKKDLLSKIENNPVYDTPSMQPKKKEEETERNQAEQTKERRRLWRKHDRLKRKVAAVFNKFKPAKHEAP